MAIEKVIDIKIQGNADEAVGSLRSQLRAAQAEVAELSNKFGATSQEAINAAKRAGQLKDQIGDAKALTDAFNPDAKFKSLSASLAGVAGGFAVVQGGMALLGTESKDVEKTLLKVQAAMALSQGLQTIGESVDSFKQLGAVVKSYTIVQRISTIAQAAFNAVMAANPIGAVVVAVTALIAAGYALVKMFQASSEEIKRSEQAHKALGKELKTQVEAQKAATIEADLSRDAQLKMAKASGKSADEIRKLSVELANQEIAQKTANAQTLRAIAIEAIRVAGLEDATESQKELAKKALKEFNDANDALKTSIINKRKLLIDNKVAETQEQTDLIKKGNEKEKEEAEKRSKELKERLKKEREELLKLQQEYAQKARDLQREEGYKAQDDIEAARKANAERLLSDEELAIQRENEAYKIKYDNAVKAGLDTEELETQHLNNLNDINLSAQDKRYQQLKEASDKELALDVAIKDAKRAALDTGLNILMQFAGKNKTIAMSILAVQKGLAIADIVVGAAKSIAAAQAALAATPAVIGVVPNPLYAVQAAATVKGIALTKITAGTSIASILAAAIGQAGSISGGGGSGAGGAGGGAGGAGGGGAAPQFNVVGNSGVNQLAGIMANNEQTPVKAYVVPSDVTTGQSLDRNIIRNASLG